ncbi:MAG: Hsp20/alpha crystallin family protein [Gammaproteobacteria bacterium]|nr:Hsp20/alpha crystallin family protein [Gammaproteobacteria bacterium]
MFSNISDAMQTMTSLQDAMGRTMQSDWFGRQTTSRGAQPPINVFEQGDGVAVLAEIPGANKSDFNLQVKGNTLRLSGKRGIAHDTQSSAQRLERKSFKFDRTVTVPFEIEPKSVQANYNDGVLAILLSRNEADKPQNVEVK